MVPRATQARIAGLPCWQGAITAIIPLPGGMTNRNYRVDCAGEAFAVRLGADIPSHGVMRFNELAAARAAHAVGLSPEVVHAARGLMVSRFIAGRTLDAAELREARHLPAIVAMLRCCHQVLPAHLEGPVLAFQVFHAIRNYLRHLRNSPGALLRDELPRLDAMARSLEQATPAMTTVFCHNDLLAGNFLHDGQRLWLIDWDYAGFGHPLFDLANLSANNDFGPAQDQALLAAYFGTPPDPDRLRAFAAMQCASVLRELLWGAVSHDLSRIRFDFAAYTAGWLPKLARRWETFGSAPRA